MAWSYLQTCQDSGKNMPLKNKQEETGNIRGAAPLTTTAAGSSAGRMWQQQRLIHQTRLSFQKKAEEGEECRRIGSDLRQL